MKQNQNNIDCAPTKQEEGVAKCLIQMCKDSNAAITSFSMDCEDGYKVTISARKKGRAEGMNQRSLDIAKNMLADGVDINQIMKYSGLTQEQIEKLK
jgi:predicted transposase/invertase (TIGR01784 family)